MTGPPLLLIEDTPSLQLVYESVLRNVGHLVHVEGTAAAGLAAFHRLNPSVVLLDLLLPDRDGLDLMQEMLATRPRILGSTLYCSRVMALTRVADAVKPMTKINTRASQKFAVKASAQNATLIHKMAMTA